jgi:hypothetical protein
MTDYAARLFEPSKPPPETARDYASELFGGVSAPVGAVSPIAPEADFGRDAGIGTQAVASIAQDPQARLRYYAQQRGIPEDRYRVVDGRVAYQGDDKKFYWEEPPGEFLNPRSWPGALARGVGPSISTVPAAAAGIATAPMAATGVGLAGTVGAAAAGGAVGQMAREAIARDLMGQETSGYRVAENAAIEGLAQGVGIGAGALMQRGQARDIARLNRPAANALQTQARAHGIELTPAELTNLPSLKAQQKVVGNLPASADTMAQFYENRAANQIAPAVERQLAAISPQDSAELAGRSIRTAAQQAMDQVAADRAAQASPIYQRAFQAAPAVDVSPVISAIDNRLPFLKGPIRQNVERARALLFNGQTPDGRLQALHNAKLAIDEMIAGQGENSVGNVSRRELTQIQQGLLRQMDAASPDYGSARQIFANLSPGVNEVREGVVGILADLPDTQTQKAAAKLFAPDVGVQSATEARRLLNQADPAAWQAIKRSYLEDTWLKSQKETLAGGPSVNAGAKWRQSLMGVPKQRAVLQATLDPHEFAALDDLSQVLEAAGRVKPIGSDTAYNQEIIKDLKDNALGPLRLLRLASPGDFGNQLADALVSWRTNGQTERLAQIITSPDGMRRLRELRQLSPNQWRAAAAAGHVATAGARIATQ